MSVRLIRLALITLLVVALGALGACERADVDGSGTDRVERPVSSPGHSLPGFVVGQVATREGPRADAPIDALEPREVGRRFRRAVLALPMFEDEGGPGPTIDFSVEVSAGLGSAEPPPPAAGTGTGMGTGASAPVDGDYVVLYLATEGRSLNDPRYQFELQGIYRERIGDGEEPAQTADRLLDDGIADLVEGLRLEAAPRVASDQALPGMLETDDVDGQLAVIREIHRRRLASAAPQLRALLDSPEVEVLIAAATALGRIRDRQAVAPLIDLISRERRELTEIVIPILGQINTWEARIYLETVSEAELRPQWIRDLARTTLEDAPPPPAPER